jgi:2-hydroxycyclohexanecarboxyl-CoA dehydrogenase
LTREDDAPKEKRRALFMDIGLAGKTVIVVGGSSNLGRACSIALAKEGANVIVVARNAQDCQKVVDECNALEGGGTAMTIPTDATELDQCKILAKKTVERFGRIDSLVISMGWNKLGHFLDLEPADWERIIATNYWNTLTLLKSILPIMIEQKKGNVVVMSSVEGRKPTPLEPVYGALKAAQISLMHSLAQEHGKNGLRFNIVAPAATPPSGPGDRGSQSNWNEFDPETLDELCKEFIANTPLGSLGKSTDVANAVLYFVSDVMSGHVTGNVIGTDGGVYMGR